MASYSDFLAWKNPVQTGSVFAALNLLAFVVCFCSPVLTMAYIGLFLMTIGLVLSTAYPTMSQNVPDELVTTEQTAAVAEGISAMINAIFLEGKALFFWTDAMIATRAGLALYVLKFISPFFSLTTLLLVSLEAVFLLPLAWTKADLGPKVTPHLEMAKKNLEKAWLAIPRASHVKKD